MSNLTSTISFSILVASTAASALFDNPTVTLWTDLDLERAKDFHPRIHNDRWPEYPAFCEHPHVSNCPLRRNPETWINVVSNGERITILIDGGFYYEVVRRVGERVLAGSRPYGFVYDRPMYDTTRVFGGRFLDSLEMITSTSDGHRLTIRHISPAEVHVVIDGGWKTIVLEFIERGPLSHAE